jgi:deoxyribodipyrimidine photo-lyase
LIDRRSHLAIGGMAGLVEGMRYQVAIHWFRRDLRLLDNTALHAASNEAGAVVPVYVVSGWQGGHQWTGPGRQQFLADCLASLAENLKTIGGQLVFRQGSAEMALRALVTETGAEAIYFNRDPDPFGQAIERKIAALCADLGIGCHGFDDVTMHTPAEVLTQKGEPFRVFTPYGKAWLALPKRPPLGKPAHLNSPTAIPSLPVPTLATWGLVADATVPVEAGERAARLRLKAAVSDCIPRYHERRDLLGEPGTSRLSQDLRFGTVSIRSVFAAAAAVMATGGSAAANALVFQKELAWREFYMQILARFPDVLELEFNPEFRGLPWDEPGDAFEAWKSGRTGFPIIDAAIRQLLATGFMHNRARMITAMFLTKDLHIDWRLGESFFMRHLIDGEISSNNGGWQWSAGTGADAAPYFRIQNPWLQTARFDPHGTYIRRWIPELAAVEAKKFTAPPADGRYPLPIIDHHRERDRTLAIFKAHRERAR